MEFKPYTELSPIKPDKPVLDLNQGVLYMNGNNMKDLKMHAMSSIKTIEFEPEPLDIMNECKHVYTNLSPQNQAIFNVSFNMGNVNLNNNIISPKVTDAWTMKQYNKIQKKKHHKTRINKKWAKKYGYWTVEDVFKVNSLTPKDIANEKLTYEGDLEFKERRIY